MPFWVICVDLQSKRTKNIKKKLHFSQSTNFYVRCGFFWVEKKRGSLLTQHVYVALFHWCIDLNYRIAKHLLTNDRMTHWHVCINGCVMCCVSRLLPPKK